MALQSKLSPVVGSLKVSTYALFAASWRDCIASWLPWWGKSLRKSFFSWTHHPWVSISGNAGFISSTWFNWMSYDLDLGSHSNGCSWLCCRFYDALMRHCNLQPSHSWCSSLLICLRSVYQLVDGASDAEQLSWWEIWASSTAVCSKSLCFGKHPMQRRCGVQKGRNSGAYRCYLKKLCHIFWEPWQGGTPWRRLMAIYRTMVVASPRDCHRSPFRCTQV